jgi:hypothetical protein
MPKLSDTQLVILSKASQRDDRIALPLPATLKGGAAQKVVASMLVNRLLEEVEAKRGQPAWRENGEAGSTTLVITDAGLAALNLGPEPTVEAPAAAESTDKPKRVRRQAKGPKRTRARKEAKPRAQRENTKQAALIDMLKRAKGATVEEIAEALDWQHHTVRGAMAGALKKKLGLKIVSEKHERRGRIYRIQQ